jgi:ribulose bisphosphate carboxylase small subunit
VADSFSGLRYLTPLTSTSLGRQAKDLPISEWWTRAGVRVSDDQVKAALSAVGAQFNPSGGKVTVAPGSAPATSIDPVQYLLRHGYTQVTSYQLDSRYWTLQWIEFGWLATLAALLLGTAFWLLRRRPA